MAKIDIEDLHPAHWYFELVFIPCAVFLFLLNPFNPNIIYFGLVSTAHLVIIFCFKTTKKDK